jgi:hypothetical protein
MTGVLVLIGLGFVTVLSLWLVRRETPRNVHGWAVRGLAVYGEEELLRELGAFCDGHPLLAKLNLRDEIIIEWVEKVWTSTNPFGDDAGSIEGRNPFLFFGDYYAVVVCRRNRGLPGDPVWRHASLSAIPHETFHVAALLLGGTAYDDDENFRTLMREWEARWTRRS